MQIDQAAEAQTRMLVLQEVTAVTREIPVLQPLIGLSGSLGSALCSPARKRGRRRMDETGIFLSEQVDESRIMCGRNDCSLTTVVRKRRFCMAYL